MLLESLLESCPEKILTWPNRLAILIEIAKAVHFLHTGVIPGSFNNQLKTNNILLDEHKIAKLSDYGVSAIIEENEKLLEVFSVLASFCILFLLILRQDSTLQTKSEGHKSKYDVANRTIAQYKKRGLSSQRNGKTLMIIDHYVETKLVNSC